MTTKDERGYKGWPNYETWCVNAWLTTEPHIYERLMAIVQNPDTLGEQAEALQDWVRPDQGDDDEPGMAGMYVDLLATAFDMVVWREIVRTNQSGPSEGQR
jgi:hypothetical protein